MHPQTLKVKESSISVMLIKMIGEEGFKLFMV